MSQSFIKKPDNGPHSALFGLGVLQSEQPRPPCTVCGTAYEMHGSYPTCASHPYSPDGRCGHVGIFADGRFTGAPCAGAECRNGCARASGVAPSDDAQRLDWLQGFADVRLEAWFAEGAIERRVAHNGHTIGSGRTLREAIDAARAACPRGPADAAGVGGTDA